jgi:colanic acid biosynthesis glycosyl transferase WcaI
LPGKTLTLEYLDRSFRAASREIHGMSTSQQTKNPTNKDQKKIEVLVVTTQYAPDFGPSAPIYTALCEDLQQIGCNVTVITAFPHYANAKELFWNSKKLIEESISNGVRIIRTYIYTVPKSSLWRRLLYHASFNFFSTLALLKVKKPDIILADAPTLCSGMALAFKSFIGRTPFIYIVQDIYPDVLERLGVLRNQRILNFIGSVEKAFYKKAACISVLSEGFKENIVHKGIPAEKITVIPVGVDTDFIKPMTRDNELREKWDLENKFVVLYAGNIGFSQGLETIVHTAKLLNDQADISFVIVGDGSMKGQLQAMAKESGLSSVKILPFQPRECVPLLYAMADVCLVPLKRDIVVESVPSKTYSIMASGRPFIAAVDKRTEIGQLAEQTHSGIRVEPENSEELSKVILKLKKDNPLRKEMGERGRNYVMETCSRHTAAKQHLELILKSLGQDQPVHED